MWIFYILGPCKSRKPQNNTRRSYIYRLLVQDRSHTLYFPANTHVWLWAALFHFTQPLCSNGSLTTVAGEPESETRLHLQCSRHRLFCRGSLLWAWKNLVWMQLHAAVKKKKKKCYKSCMSHWDIRLFPLSPLVLIFIVCASLFKGPIFEPSGAPYNMNKANNCIDFC